MVVLEETWERFDGLPNVLTVPDGPPSRWELGEWLVGIEERLDRLVHALDQTADVGAVLTLKECAAMLGLGTRTVQRKIETDGLPAVHLSPRQKAPVPGQKHTGDRGLRFLKADVLDYLRQKQPGCPEAVEPQKRTGRPPVGARSDA